MKHPVACGFAPMLALIGAMMAALPIAARAQDAAAITSRHLYAGTLSQGEAELAALVAREPGNAAARFGLGGVQFLGAVERLGQSMHRHGLEAPRSVMLPILRLPVPPNSNPQPLTYEGFRQILQQFADDLAKVDASLADVAADVKVTIDLAGVRLDLNGDGAAAQDERLWSILGLIDPRVRGAAGAAPETFAVTFDNGDVFWLRGYSHLMRGIVELWLAHDFRPSFEQSFHAFLPRAQLPYAAALGLQKQGQRVDFGSLADFVAFIHLFNWPVVDAPRLPRAMTHLRAVANLSRQSFAAILAETDDDREWIPNPRQTNQFPSLPVTQDRIDGWLAAMGEVDAVLDGKKLVPHWRFDKGINVRRAFLEHKTLDPVMWITGVGIVPFLEDGPVITSEAWDDMVRAFQGNFFGYAVWFN